MKNIYLQVELWIKNKIKSFVFLSLLIFLYIVLAKVPYLNLLLSNGDLLTCYIAICVLTVFRTSVFVTVILGLGILFFSVGLSLIGYASNADIFGVILYVMITYLLIISIVKK